MNAEGPATPRASGARGWRRALRLLGILVEIGLGLAIVPWLILSPGVGDIVVVFAVAVWDAIGSLVPLLRVDFAATAWLLLLAVAKLALAGLPAALLIRSAPRHRRAWLVPVIGLLFVVSVPLSIMACATAWGWVALAAASGLALALMRVRFLRWAAVLPFAIFWQVIVSHGALGWAQIGTEDAAFREQLLADCAKRPGRRPINLTADLLMPYHGIIPFGDDLVLLTGEGANDGGMRGRTGGRPAGSWWLRRRNGAFEFQEPSHATGNLWRGCALDDTIWIARANHIVGVTRLPGGNAGHENVQRLRVPSSDMDFGETACDPDHGRVYVTEALLGGMWEITPGGAEPVNHHVGGIWLLPKRRFDGRIVLTNTASLLVFSPDDDRVVEDRAAGFAILGFDLCPLDGAVAVADTMGRLRVFEMDPAGDYRFAWGVSLFAPRRVAYSPDCSHIAVTSADDHSVFLIDRATRRIVDTLQGGPALREVAATAEREFSVADICSMTSFRY